VSPIELENAVLLNVLPKPRLSWKDTSSSLRWRD